MANPSTTGPSGIGSEVLRRVQFNGLDGSGGTPTTVLTVGTDMIITILSLAVTNTNASTKTVSIIVAPDGSGTNYISRDNNVPTLGTFVWNDKLVLTETDILKVGSTSTNFDLWCSYIEQEFA